MFRNDTDVSFLCLSLRLSKTLLVGNGLGHPRQFEISAWGQRSRSNLDPRFGGVFRFPGALEVLFLQHLVVWENLPLARSFPEHFLPGSASQKFGAPKEGGCDQVEVFETMDHVVFVCLRNTGICSSQDCEGIHRNIITRSRGLRGSRGYQCENEPPPPSTPLTTLAEMITK